MIFYFLQSVLNVLYVIYWIELKIEEKLGSKVVFWVSYCFVRRGWLSCLQAIMHCCRSHTFRG